MKNVELEDLSKNLDDYTKLDQSEVIQVTDKGNVVFEGTLERAVLMAKAEKLIGILPKDIPDKVWQDKDI